MMVTKGVVMFSLNRAQIIGNVTRDPELRYIPSGQGVTSFGVATNRRWRDKDGNNQEQTEFHDVVAWGKLAELLNQLIHKGNKIFIEGRLQTRQWEAQDGSKKQRTEIVAEDFVLLTPKGSASGDVSESGDEFPTKEEPKAKTEKPEKKKADEPASADKSASDDEINLDEIPF
jgi:single-strand DNA-binding protein